MWFASGPHAIPPWFVLADASAPGRIEGPLQARIVVQPAIQMPARARVDAGGTSQVPRQSILCLCLGLRPRPNRRSLASGGLIGAAPAAARAKASACYRFRGYRGASAPAVYASRVMLPSPMQDSLPAGWLAFTGRESNPLDRGERFPSFYISSSSPGFTLTLHCRDSVRLQSYFHRPDEPVRTPARDPTQTSRLCEVAPA